MKNVIINKENGNISIQKADEEAIKEIKKSEACHLCWENCANAYASKCQKIFDLPKNTVDEYDFITEGTQIIDKNGKIETFLVTGCENYENVEQKEYTNEELFKINAAKKKLMMLYFGTESIEDAFILQYELEQRDEIYNIHGRRPSEKDIMRLIRKKYN